MEGRLDARLRDLPPDVFHELVGKVSGIDEFKGWWRGRGPQNPSILRRLRRRAIEVSADASIRVSSRPLSSPLPPPPTWGQRQPGPADRRLPPWSGYAELLRSVVDGYPDMVFGEDLFLRFHDMLFRYSAADRGHRGQYKTDPGKTSSYFRGETESLALRPTEPHLTPRDMKILTEWTTARLESRAFHPLLVIASFLLEFLAIRPFADGNGRVSRVIAVFLLLKCGYGHVPYLSLERIVADRRTEYLIALRRAQAKRNFLRPDISPWLRAFLDVLQAQAGELRSLLEGRTREDLLSGNQRSVLALLDRNREVSTLLVCRELGLPRDTAKQVLGRLLALSLVSKTGAGRATRYRKAPLPTG